MGTTLGDRQQAGSNGYYADVEHAGMARPDRCTCCVRPGMPTKGSHSTLYAFGMISPGYGVTIVTDDAEANGQHKPQGRW